MASRCSKFASVAAKLGPLVVIVTLAGCHTTADRYRLTASIEADGVVYRGSSVQEFRCRNALDWAKSMDVSNCRIRGEAIVVDLGSRGQLFVLLRGASGSDMTSMVRAVLGARGQNPFEPSSVPLAKHWELAPGAEPWMVKFVDRADPRSVVQVLPDDIAQAFGPGVHWRGIQVDETKDKVTRATVEHFLPWASDGKPSAYLANYGTRRVSVGEGDGLAGRLQFTDFVSKP